MGLNKIKIQTVFLRSDYNEFVKCLIFSSSKKSRFPKVINIPERGERSIHQKQYNMNNLYPNIPIKCPDEIAIRRRPPSPRATNGQDGGQVLKI